MSAGGWQSITGTSAGRGELQFSSPMSTFVYNGTGALSLDEEGGKDFDMAAVEGFFHPRLLKPMEISPPVAAEAP